MPFKSKVFMQAGWKVTRRREHQCTGWIWQQEQKSRLQKPNSWCSTPLKIHGSTTYVHFQLSQTNKWKQRNKHKHMCSKKRHTFKQNKHPCSKIQTLSNPFKIMKNFHIFCPIWLLFVSYFNSCSFLSNLFVISIGDAFRSRCRPVSGERSNWCEEGIKLSMQLRHTVECRETHIEG